MAPVLGKVQDAQIDQETEQWPGFQHREPILELRRNDVVEAQPAFEVGEQGCQQGENEQWNDSQPVEEGIQHVYPHRLAIRPDLDRSQRLQGSQQQKSDGDLQYPAEEELDAVESHFQIAAHSRGQQHGLQQMRQ
ncbi:MAG: hypothetical protein AW09_003551 [Candidatus Accumulibacter phosphatis]|uniref:Uncharacterized protein n=1 Tax=Candidatus Accumulibacter phosphatis TaxID=327160 RepID=A0A080LUH1_9PROT|nr:MAG: hypothetical protein AW09_003551 [Candidatus Accumulibacter phosphatis]